MGYNTKASGATATAIGYGAVASGVGSVALGNGSTASGHSSVAMGYTTVASGTVSTAMGWESQATAMNSLAASGGVVENAGTNAVAMGKGATAKLADSVALGSGAVADREGGKAGYDASTNAASTNTSETWVASANAIAVGGGQNPDGKIVTRQIIGVAAGSEDTDAVNVAQLKKVYTEIYPSTNGNYIQASNSAGENITNLDVQVKQNANDISAVNQNVNTLGNRINRMDDRIDRVGAGAAALAALHPQDFDPDDKWDFAAGYGHYRSANAMAIGAFYRPDARTMFSLGGSMGSGENLINAGVTFKLGKSSPYAGYSKAALTTVIAEQKTQINSLETKVATQNEKLAAQDQTIAKQQAQIESILQQLAELKK